MEFWQWCGDCGDNCLGGGGGDRSIIGGGDSDSISVGFYLDCAGGGSSVDECDEVGIVVVFAAVMLILVMILVEKVLPNSLSLLSLF